MKIDKTTFKVKKWFLENQRIRTFLQVSNSILLFGNEDSIYVMDTYKEEILYKTDFKNNMILYKDKQNKIWLKIVMEGFFNLKLPLSNTTKNTSKVLNKIIDISKN